MNKMKINLLATAAISLFALASCNQPAATEADSTTEQAALVEKEIERIDVGTHYSQIAMTDDLIVLTGQVSDGATITEQAEGIFKTIDSHLAKAGSDKSKILSANVYLTDMKEFDEYNAAWEKWMGSTGGKVPARTTVGVSELAGPQWRIEIQVYAVK